MTNINVNLGLVTMSGQLKSYFYINIQIKEDAMDLIARPV